MSKIYRALERSESERGGGRWAGRVAEVLDPPAEPHVELPGHREEYEKLKVMLSLEAKRNELLAQANAIVAKDRPRLPIVAVGSAWAMQKAKVTISPRVDEDTLAMDIKPAK